MKFDTRNSPPLPSADGRSASQQVSITARHELFAGANEADRVIAQRSRPPRFGTGTYRTEQSFGDGTVGGAIEVAIKGTQTESQSLLPLPRSPMTEGRLGARDVPIKSNGGSGTNLSVDIQRNDGGKGCVLHRAFGHPESMLAAAIDENEVETVCGRPRNKLAAPSRGPVPDGPRGFGDTLFENDGGGIKLWPPKDRSVVSASVGIGKEIATPNAGRGHHERPPGPRQGYRRHLGADIRVDSPDYAVGTPTRGRQASRLRHIRSRLQSANPVST